MIPSVGWRMFYFSGKNVPLKTAGSSGSWGPCGRFEEERNQRRHCAQWPDVCRRDGLTFTVEQDSVEQRHLQKPLCLIQPKAADPPDVLLVITVDFEKKPGKHSPTFPAPN
jgi:hypothetical protein